VVSAQKREQNIQDVGISMTAYTGEQLKAVGVQESYEVAAFTPGVATSGNLAGQNTQFTIRGVTQNDFNDIVEAPNASNDDRWQFNVEVKNLTNAHAGVQGFDLATLCGCNEVAYQPPRWTGINVKVKF
jgi:outer membrane receptor protein involved in Fe transport